MSRGFILATTSNFTVIGDAATSVCDEVVKTDERLNCYCGDDGVLLSIIAEAASNPTNDFKEALDLFSVRPISIPLYNFTFLRGQIIGRIDCTNKIFKQLDNLIIMVNFPGIIIYKNIASLLSNDNHYDWYGNEENLSIFPDLF